jgi:hypothetical protein
MLCCVCCMVDQCVLDGNGNGIGDGSNCNDD